MAFPLSYDEKETRPLQVVPVSGFDAWLSGQSDSTRRWIEASGFQAKAGRCCLLPRNEKVADSVVGAVGIVASNDDLSAAAAWPEQLPPGDWAPRGVAKEQLAPLAWYWCAGAYRFDVYREAAGERPRLVLPEDSRDAETAVASLYLIRDLVNTPAQDMGPEELAQCAGDLARGYGGKVRLVRGNHLLSGGYPAIHAVGRAARREPILIDLSWGDPKAPRVSLVGKGVVFDSGGLDIKNAAFMRNMKKDMGGAAHVLGLCRLIMSSELPVRLRVLIPAVENAIDGDAYRPGDVVATRKGLTVEVHNTDAEGRVVLADALAQAAEDKPELIIDFATLTGAARIALGSDIPALYSNDDELAEGLLRETGRVGEPLWRMPLHPGYESMLDSTVADLVNATESRHAGSITAALFLQRFVPPQQSWAHLDIYAWNDVRKPGKPVGGDAQCLRGVFAYLANRFSSQESRFN
ncbi:MAG: leucyl aminopeptidase family protein [Gammaproteobacteria bacterium]|nr:MAG: leucyl aminopeptidase family protein [Gammaproteobacteria bacterium]